MKTAPQVRWKLPALLQQERVSIYRLDQELAKRVSRTTLYKWGSAPGPKHIDPEVMGWILWGLERITGRRYKVEDLLEIDVPSSQPETEYVLDPESAAWLEAELTQPLPPYDWGEAGEPEGQRVRYSPEEGFLGVEDETV